MTSPKHYHDPGDLRVAIHRHLMRAPHRTACQIARALGLPHPQGGGALRVQRQLRLMAGDGEARPLKGHRRSGGRRPVTRWVAT